MGKIMCTNVTQVFKTLLRKAQYRAYNLFNKSEVVCEKLMQSINHEACPVKRVSDIELKGCMGPNICCSTNT